MTCGELVPLDDKAVESFSKNKVGAWPDLGMRFTEQQLEQAGSDAAHNSIHNILNIHNLNADDFPTGEHLLKRYPKEFKILYDAWLATAIRYRLGLSPKETTTFMARCGLDLPDPDLCRMMSEFLEEGSEEGLREVAQKVFTST